MNTEAQPCAARGALNRLSSRLAREKQELVLFLIELADFDRKKLGLELGYPLTLGCLVGELGLTESSACRRISAARLLARFPGIARYLVANRLTLTGLIALKEVIDDSNVEDLLERAAGLSEPAVRELVTRIRMEAARPAEPAEVATQAAAAAMGVKVVVACAHAARCSASACWFRCTSPIAFQSRVAPDHRSGWR